MPGRKPILVDRVDLEKVVNDLEAQQNFTSRGSLWAAVAATDYAKSIGLSSQVAALKAKAWGLTLKTPLGKRGGGEALAKARAAKGNAGVRTKKRIPLELISGLKSKYDSVYHSKVDKAANGSLKSALALVCIDCCAQDKKEVALCCLTNCILWSFRPYKDPLSLTEEGRKAITYGEVEGQADRESADLESETGAPVGS